MYGFTDLGQYNAYIIHVYIIIILMGFMDIEKSHQSKSHSQNPRLILTFRVQFCFEVTIHKLQRTL